MVSIPFFNKIVAKRKQKKLLSAEERALIEEMNEDGLTLQQIADDMNVDVTTIHRYLKRREKKDVESDLEIEKSRMKIALMKKEYELREKEVELKQREIEAELAEYDEESLTDDIPVWLQPMITPIMQRMFQPQIPVPSTPALPPEQTTLKPQENDLKRDDVLLSDEQIADVIRKIPANVIKQVKNGKVTYADAWGQVSALYPQVKEKQFKQIWEKLK